MRERGYDFQKGVIKLPYCIASPKYDISNASIASLASMKEAMKINLYCRRPSPILCWVVG